jgi:hypothetical protein
MLQPGRYRGRDRVHEQLVRTSLGRPTAKIRVAEQDEYDRQRQDDVHRPSQYSEAVRSLAERGARPRVDCRHRDDADEECHEPGGCAPRPEREDAVGRHQKRPHQPWARAGDPAADHVRERHPHRAGSDERHDVPLEAARRGQKHKIADAEDRQHHCEHVARRMALRLDRERQRREDGQDAGGYADALPKPQVILIGRFVRQREKALDESSGGPHRRADAGTSRHQAG